MNFYADYVRNKLNAAISSMSSQIEDYVKNPGHDFTRNRKMNFTSTINFLLTMEWMVHLTQNYINILIMI